MQKTDLIKEMDFCIKLWSEKGYCNFGKKTNCANCATLYLLRKLISGEIVDTKKLSLNEWKDELEKMKSGIYEN